MLLLKREVERPLVKLLCPWSQLRSFHPYKRRLEAHGALGSVTVGDRGRVVAFVQAVGAQGRGEAQA